MVRSKVAHQVPFRFISVLVFTIALSQPLQSQKYVMGGVGTERLLMQTAGMRSGLTNNAADFAFLESGITIDDWILSVRFNCSSFNVSFDGYEYEYDYYDPGPATTLTAESIGSNWKYKASILTTGVHLRIGHPLNKPAARFFIVPGIGLGIEKPFVRDVITNTHTFFHLHYGRSFDYATNQMVSWENNYYRHSTATDVLGDPVSGISCVLNFHLAMGARIGHHHRISFETEMNRYTKARLRSFDNISISGGLSLGMSWSYFLN